MRKMTKETHDDIVEELRKTYINKKFTYFDELGEEIITNVYVDYRDDCQFLNRFMTDCGNIYFIDEIKDIELK